MMYLTYDEYLNLGGSAKKADFFMLEIKARKRIDYLTDCRVSRMNRIPLAVKACMASMINIESTVGVEAQTSKAQVSSFTTDGYSESYRQPMTASQVAKEQDKLIATMLYGEVDDEGTPLLFRGLF